MRVPGKSVYESEIGNTQLEREILSRNGQKWKVLKKQVFKRVSSWHLLTEKKNTEKCATPGADFFLLPTR